MSDQEILTRSRDDVSPRDRGGPAPGFDKDRWPDGANMTWQREFTNTLAVRFIGRLIRDGDTRKRI